MRSPGVQGLGLDVGGQRATGGGGGGGGASNLLLWTEAMDNSIWLVNGGVVTPDVQANPSPPGDGSLTADLCAFVSGSRFARQTTALAGTTIAGSPLAINPSASATAWTRFPVTQTVDGVTYTLSLYLLWLVGTGTLSLSLSAAGGFVRAGFTTSGIGVSVYPWGWQLETGGTATGYVPRTT